MKLFIISLLISTGLFAQSQSLNKTFEAMDSGDFKLALTHLTRVIENDSTNPELFRLKGMLLESLGENDKALVAWKQCEKFSENNSLTLEANNHIQFLIQSR